jgi:putative flippase GtrA
MINLQLFIKQYFALFKSAVVGVAATGVHLSTMAVILSFDATTLLLANACGFICSVWVSFLIQYKWIFRSQGKMSSAAAKFIFIAITTFLLNSGILMIMDGYQFEQKNMIGFCIVLAVTAGALLINLKWTFKLAR